MELTPTEVYALGDTNKQTTLPGSDANDDMARNHRVLL
jgi:hypothetical protein